MPKRKKRISLLEGKEINLIPSNPEKVKSVDAIPVIPSYYEDKEFKCQDCGEYSIWYAKDQKWWYETKEKPIESIAIRCLSCRKQLRADKESQKEHMKKMSLKEPHPNETFFKNT